MRKRILAIVLAALFAAVSPAIAVGPPGSGSGGVNLASDCSTYIAIGTLCQDTDDGKLYKGTGAAVVEIAAGSSGDFLADGSVPMTGPLDLSTAGAVATVGEIGYASNAFSWMAGATSEKLQLTAGANLWTFSSDTAATFAFTPSVALNGGATLGGTLALGANSITMSGSIGVTGTRVTKGWFTDLEVTNAIAGSVTGTAASLSGSALPADSTIATSLSIGADPAEAGAIRLSNGAAIVWEDGTEASITHVDNIGWLINGGNELQFRDSTSYIWSSGAGVIGLASTTQIDLNTALIATTAGITMDDGTGDSPALTLKDGTDETAAFVKKDAGYLQLTTVAGDGLQIITGNLKVGGGSPNQDSGPDGEDAYITGKLEVDGIIYGDGGVLMGGQSKLYSANADPTGTAGYILHDSTVTNHARGAVRWHDGTNIRQFVDMTAAIAEGCTDTQVVAYSATNDYFYCKDDADSAGTPTVITVADEAADTTSFPLFVTAATGDLGPKTNAGLTFNAATGVLGATGFSGPINGTVGATTPAAGAFTTLTASTSLAVTAAAATGGYIRLLEGTNNGTDYSSITGAADAGSNPSFTFAGSAAGSEDMSLTASANLWTFNSSTSATFAFGQNVNITGAQFKLPSSDADPTATAGYFRHDSSSTSSSGGGLLAWHDGTNIRQVVDTGTTYTKITKAEYLPIRYAEDDDSVTAPAATAEIGTSTMVARSFAEDADNGVVFWWQVPFDYVSGIKYRVYYATDTNAAANETAAFSVAGCSVGNLDAIACSEGTAVVVTDELDDTYDTGELIVTGWSAEVTVTDIVAGEMAKLLFIRDVSEDDMVGHALVVGIEIKYVAKLNPFSDY